jgi:hypothetical protein
MTVFCQQDLYPGYEATDKGLFFAFFIVFGSEPRQNSWVVTGKFISQ